MFSNLVLAVLIFLLFGCRSHIPPAGMHLFENVKLNIMLLPAEVSWRPRGAVFPRTRWQRCCNFRLPASDLKNVGQHFFFGHKGFVVHGFSPPLVRIGHKTVEMFLVLPRFVRICRGKAGSVLFSATARNFLTSSDSELLVLEKGQLFFG